jgi:5-formyltetrahydrofolate cyclo-ligase
VLEPRPGQPTADLEHCDAVVVPGVAFDRDGHRLGRGQACYDRTFPPGAATSPLLVGFGYAFQVVDRVPSDEFDRQMDWIVTETQAHRCTSAAARDSR